MCVRVESDVGCSMVLRCPTLSYVGVSQEDDTNLESIFGM